VTWNVTSLPGKELELVCEVDWYQLGMVGLTSTHSTGSGTKLLERGWTLLSKVAQDVRRQADVGILTSPRLSADVLEFSPVNERVASMRLTGGKTDCCVCLCTEQQFRVSGRLGVPGLASWKGFQPGTP